MTPEDKEALIKELGKLRNRVGKLKELGIPVSSYYSWKARYKKEGFLGLMKQKNSRKVWNRLTEYEKGRVLETARNHPELSCRLLAVKITDREEFSISEATVYRLLKKEGLIEPRPILEMPAKEWRHKTKTPDEIWQCDASHFFVAGWGYYKMITVQDDYSRYPLASRLKPDETAFSISDVIEEAIENAKKYGHLKDESRPRFLSDNGPGFTAGILSDYLRMHGIKHIFGKPYHPQTQGKIERFHRSIKEKVCLLVYCSPEELEKALEKAIRDYSLSPHKSLKNVSPKDVYEGRQGEILERREKKKQLTLERRRLCNSCLAGRQVGDGKWEALISEVSIEKGVNFSNPC